MRYWSIVMAGILAAAVAGCTNQQTFPPAAFQPVEPDRSLYSKKVDTFVVVLDTGSAMERTYRKRLEADRAQEIVSWMNRMIPPLDYQAALLYFSSGSCLSCEDATVLYGPGPYKRDEFAAGLDGYKAAGETSRVSPLSRGVEASRIILQGNPGRVAVIVASDSENVLHGRAFKSVQKLKGALGDRLCIYPIQVDKACDGRRMMDELVKVGGCGFAVNADDIASPQAMADYVKEVFLTSAAAPVAAAPLYTALDADGDGVPDSLDKCPNTPKGVKVDADGCWVLRGVYFDTGQAVIRGTYAMNEALAVLKANPNLTVEVYGHTDSTASSDYNQKLSEARAKAVRDYLINQGVQPERIQAKGFGETRPIASNETEEGRALNRRVELHPHIK
jgi:OOP family OmpA-OmpF porin